MATATRDLPQGVVVLDVGAHVGLTALTMAALRSDITVIAFEPIPAALECLCQNIAVNGLDNVRVEPVAVSDQNGEIMLTNNGPWSTGAPGASMRCQARTLDDYDVTRVGLVKIDVEGHEPNVLAGMRRILAEQSPLVLLEFNAWTLLLHHYDPLLFANTLLSNFEVLGVFSRGKRVPSPSDGLSLLHENLVRDGCVTDLLLRPRSPLPALRAMVSFQEV